MKNKPPILFLIYKRPDLAERVFWAIADFKPTDLFIAADGFKNDDEQENCRKTREIINKINWKCKVHTLFRQKHLGCKDAVSSAISWFFEYVDEGIILEDDCLPHQSFFQFCEELLNRYKNDTRILHISGNNFQKEMVTKSSYYFSKFPHIWGWATWRRAWNLYDRKMKLWPEARDTDLLRQIFNSKQAVKYWTYIFNKVYDNEIDTWDYQWTFGCWLQNGLSILPSRNLVQNIGFSGEATHTKRIPKSQNIKANNIQFPLKHPSYIIPNLKADLYTQKTIFVLSPLILHIYYTLRRFFNND